MFDSAIFDSVIFDVGASAVADSLLNPRPAPWYTTPARPLFVAGPRRRQVLDDAELVAIALAAGISSAELLALLVSGEEEPIWS